MQPVRDALPEKKDRRNAPVEMIPGIPRVLPSRNLREIEVQDFAP